MSLFFRSFSTASVPQHATLSKWRDFMAEVYYSVDVKPRHASRIRGELQESRVGPIGISRFAADQQRVFRYAEAARHDHDESFVFIFPVRQQAYFEQRGQSGFVLPGNAVLLNSSEYYEASCPDGFENVTLKIPCAALRSKVPQIDDLCGKLEPAHPAIARSIIGMVSPLLSLETPLTASQEAGLAHSIFDLLSLMLNQDDKLGVRYPTAAVSLQRVKTYMQNNLSEHELSPAIVAKSCSISVRYLHKLFAGSETTFGKVLLDMRLGEARRLIQSDRFANTTLQQIAFACGFSNQSHFSTAFKARFGVTPKLAWRHDLIKVD
jgi:AraC family transcriptional activator of tynA and feaB